jgi:hypothetical protein
MMARIWWERLVWGKTEGEGTRPEENAEAFNLEGWNSGTENTARAFQKNGVAASI